MYIIFYATRIVQSFEAVLQVLVQQEDYEISQERINAFATRVSVSHSNNDSKANDCVFSLQLNEGILTGLPDGIGFSATSSSTRRRRQVASEPDASAASIDVPNSLLSTVLQTRDNIGLVFTYYSNSSLFPLVSTDSEIATPVIAVRFSDRSAEVNLTENVSVNFQLLEPVNFSCIIHTSTIK